MEKEEARLLSLVSPGAGAGTLEGHGASILVQLGGGKSHASPLTTLRVTIASPLLRLSLSRHSQWHDEQARAGHLVEVAVNDAAFDQAWVASGAPSDLVRTLLDEPLRSALMRTQEVGFSIDGDHLDVFEPRLLATPEDVQELVGIAALVTRRLSDGLHPAPGLALTPDAQAKELARFHQAESSAQRANLVFAAMMAVVGAVLLGGLFYAIRKRSRARRA